ncbi:hypothetical protein LIER_19689 [Lithospermum erythrorhizon]|uniref:40S ribosomal protein SA n=1 Tax=Lithospermum erythrorhizon TaxID=34254 RepID=A0AAV3QKZ6_LITER
MAMSTKELDIQMMLAAEVHLGTKNSDFQMERYIFKRRNDVLQIKSHDDNIEATLQYRSCFGAIVYEDCCQMDIQFAAEWSLDIDLS